MNIFRVHQASRSSLYCSILILFVMAVFLLDHTDGLSWISVPDEHTYIKHGVPYAITWHYEMEENETFLHSEIYSLNHSSKSYIAVRSGPNVYGKYQRHYAPFSVFGRNNVTLIVHKAKIGNNITYCCEVTLTTAAGPTKEHRCSKIFVYDLPRIIHHTPQLSCKQGDSINLKCNATGIPKPHIEWTHDKNHSLIDTSSDIEVRITGKRSEGRYCCGAYNGFGEEKACTAVNVTEYQPVNTVILVNWTNKDDANMLIHVMCKAVASPPSNLFIIGINDKKYNSSYGSKTIEVLASRKLKTIKIAVSCIPWNMYGQGPFKKVIIPLYAPPRFAVSLRTKYNMTVNAITLKCEAFGTPAPRITWTSERDTGDIIGEGKFYQISYVNCDTKTLTFFCHASNVMGSISSPLIHVEVMTRRSNCSTGDDNLDRSNSYSDKRIIAITISCASVICILILILITRQFFRWWKIPKPPKDLEVTDNAEDPYQEPIDFVIADESRSLARNNTTSTDEGYASVEECRLSARMRPAQKLRNPSTGSLNNSHLEEKETIYESLVPLGL